MIRVLWYVPDKCLGTLWLTAESTQNLLRNLGGFTNLSLRKSSKTPFGTDGHLNMYLAFIFFRGYNHFFISWPLKNILLTWLIFKVIFMTKGTKILPHIQSKGQYIQYFLKTQSTLISMWRNKPKMKIAVIKFLRSKKNSWVQIYSKSIFWISSASNVNWWHSAALWVTCYRCSTLFYFSIIHKSLFLL